MKTLAIKYEERITRIEEDGSEVFDHYEVIVKSFPLADILTVVTKWDGVVITLIDNTIIETNTTTELFFR